MKKKQGMLVNNECSSWYIGRFFSSHFDIGEKKSYLAIKQYAWLDITTPLQIVWSVILMMVVSDLVIYFIVKASLLRHQKKWD